jgi:hypothetical protein
MSSAWRLAAQGFGRPTADPRFVTHSMQIRHRIVAGLALTWPGSDMDEIITNSFAEVGVLS